jgi:hypothetical protein
MIQAERAVYELRPSAPYSLARTAARYARFEDPVNRFDGAGFARLLRVGRKLGGAAGPARTRERSADAQLGAALAAVSGLRAGLRLRRARSPGRGPARRRWS